VLAAALTGGLLALPSDCAAARGAASSPTIPQSNGQSAGGSEQSLDEELEELYAEGEGEEDEVVEGSGSSSPSRTSASSGSGYSEAPTVEGSAASAGEADVRISSLKLVRTSAEALAHRAVRASQICFGFKLSASAHVRASLARASNRAGEVRWRALHDTVTLSGARGSNHARLRAANELGPGEYRLTLAPAEGIARSLLIRVR